MAFPRNSVNKVCLVGHLGADPELRYTPSGVATANFNVATTETWKDADGVQQERTEWHRIVIWRKQAEFAAEYIKKGRQVCVEGKLQTRSWEDKNGVKRYTTEIVADRVTMLGPRAEAEAPPAEAAEPPAEKEGAPPGDVGLPEEDDDLPF